jgi:hypothetical protein
MRPPELLPARGGDRFDPLVEGASYGLTPELLWKLWERVCADLTDSAGRRDEEQAQRRFHELAGRIAARGGRLRPEIGRFTRVGIEIDGDSMGIWNTDALGPRTPGRETLVEAEARRNRMETLPFRAEMERSFGESLAEVAVETNRPLPRGAIAAAERERIIFSEKAPSKDTVAHEVAHVMQYRRAQPSTNAALGSRGDPAEIEAGNAARAALAGRAVTIQQTPTAHMHLKEPGEDESPSYTTTVIAYSVEFYRNGDGLKVEVMWYELARQAGQVTHPLRDGELPPQFSSPGLDCTKLVRRLEEHTQRQMLPSGRDALLQRGKWPLSQRDPYSYVANLSVADLRQWFGERQWQDFLDGKPPPVDHDRERIQALPEDVKAILQRDGAKALDPKDYKKFLEVADKLAALSREDRAAFKLLPKKAVDDLDRFAKAVDLFIARKAELKAALDAEFKKAAAAQAPTMQGAVGKKWEGMDESKIATMSEGDRYALARQKTSELTEAQLTYMAQHPGATAVDFAKSATLMNTGETFKGIGKDIAEAANGDANSWARWAAGTGAGAKLSGWLLAVAGVLYVASWLTGVGELATIAAAGMVLLGSTLTLSLAESELRIKAASQTKTPEEFKRNVELAAAARANVAVGVAMIVLAAVLHFTAKALFPKTLESIKTSLKNFRERVRLKGSIYEIKPQIASELRLRKGELAKAVELSKQKARASAAEIDGMTTEQFVEKTEAGGDGFLDQSKLPPEQKVDFRELLKTPEGRKAVEGYKQRLVKALKTDVPAQIDRLANEYLSKLDDFLKDVEAAKNHDELKAAIDKLEAVLTEEHAKKFMEGEQDRVTKEKLDEAAGEAHDEMLTALQEAIVARVKARIAAAGPDFALTYTEAEISTIVKHGKQLGMADKMIEDMIYVGSRIKKAITAPDLMDQMKNWATEVKPRGFPYRFDDLPQFKQFSRELLEGVQRAGLPTGDVRMQGSSLRKPAANDVDIAVFVDEAVFDKLLVDRYNQRITKGGNKVTLAGKSHGELVELAADIEANPKNYNAQGDTFRNAIKSGIINSKSDIIKPLKAVRAEIAAKYPNLNIETISVLIRGGLFDLLPDLPVTGN